MTAAVLQLLCTGAAVAAAVVWALAATRLGAAVREVGEAHSRTVARLLLATALGLLVLRGAIVGLLATASVDVVSDRVWGLALSMVMAAAAVVAIVRRSRAAAALALGAALAAGAELVFTLVVGAPVPPWAGIVVAVAVVTATLARVGAQLRWGRRPAAATVSAGVVAIVAFGVVGWAGLVGPAALETEGFQAHAPGAMGGASHAGADGSDGAAGAASEGGGAAVADLVGTIDPAAPRMPVHLRAQTQDVRLGSGPDETVPAWTFGELGGPAITATVGEVLDVRLDNIDIASGVTAHWHGYAVPAASDGVAGVTQDAVAPGESFRTSFTLDRPGTYWYHTHQLGSEGVVRGLYGTLVVLPKGGAVADVDVVLAVHTFGRTVVLGSDAGAQLTRAAPGQTVRARLVNTDQIPQRFTVTGTPFRVVAIDGTDVETEELVDVAIEVPAGGRYDIGFTMGQDAVAVRAEASDAAVMVFAPTDVAAPPARAHRLFDPLTEVIAASPPDDAAADAIAAAAASGGFDTEATYVLDRLPRLVRGVPQYAYTVNGAVYPHIPSTVVEEGDTVVLTIVNRGFETHPMHPHGHTVRVLSVDGVAPAAPLWLDTFDVGPGEVWRVAFVADNPGIWMDHCHNLEHAALGMVLHIAYRGVRTPFVSGGHAGNAPE